MKLKTDEAKQIAETTANQLGGYRKLHIMIGARNFAFDKDGSLSFKVLAGRKIKYIKIILNPMDYYNVQFFTAKLNMTERENVPAENLKAVIENETGLRLSL